MNYIETLVATALVATISDWAIQAFKKSPSHIIAPFIRFWKENSYLHNILYKADRGFHFARWRNKYVALKGNKLDKDVGKETTAIDILQECIKKSTPAILSGDPGLGKTTTLETLTYQIAASSYRINIFFWLGFLFLACILLFFSPLASFIYLASYFLWEPLINRTPIPIFVEVRSLNDEITNMGKWCDEQRKEKIGGKPLFGSQHRIVWLIDGADELTSEALYANFIKGWKKIIQEGKVACVIIANRAWKSLSSEFGITSVVEILELDDNLVKKFLHNQEEFNKLESEQLLATDGIGRNPYWLKMIVDGGVYAKNKGKVIHGYVQKLLKRELVNTKHPKSDSFIPVDHLLLALANLGMTLEKENRFALTGRDALNKAWSILESSVSGQYRGKFILEKSKDASLLREDGVDKITFVHPLIQTFFVAYYLYLGDGWKQELHLTDEFRWWRAFLFLGDLIADQSPEKFESFLETIIGEGENLRRVYLASAILENTLPYKSTNLFDSMGVSNAGFLESLESLSPESKWAVLLTRHFLMSSVEQKIMLGLLKGVWNQGLDEHKVSITQLRELQGDTILERLASYFLVDDYGRPQIAQTTIRLFQSLGDKKASEYIVLMLGYEKTKDIAYDALVNMGENAVGALIEALGWTKQEDIQNTILTMNKEEKESLDRLRDRDFDEQIQSLESKIKTTKDKDERNLYEKELKQAQAMRIHVQRILAGHDYLNQFAGTFSADELHKEVVEYVLEDLRKQGKEKLVPLYSQYFQKVSELRKRTPNYRDIQNILLEIGERAVPELSRSLNNNSFDMPRKIRVAETLGVIGGNDAISALVSLLYNPILATIAYAPLEKIGEPAFDAIFKLLNSNNVNASLGAHGALERLDHKVIFERLVNMVGHVKLSIESFALFLKLLDEQPEKKKIVLSLLDKGDAVVSMYLLSYILEMGDSAIEELVSRLSDNRSYPIIHSALLSLGQNAIKPLVESLMTRDHKIRKEILRELIDLAILGIEVDQIMEELLKILMQENTDQADKSSLVAMLVTLGKPAVSSLGKLLGNENAPYWSHVFYSLYFISTQHYIAPKPLLGTLKSTNEKTRMIVMMTFMAEGNPLFLPYLLVEIPHASNEWRKFFIQMLPRYLLKSTKAILEYPKYLREQRDHKKAIAKLQNVIEHSVLQT